MSRTLFYLFAAVSLCGAVNVLLQKRTLNAALSLVVCLAGIAGVYFTLGAPLIGWIQFIVYAGAVMVLFVITIMLVGPYTASGERSDRLAWRIQSALLGCGVLVLVLFATARFTTRPEALAATPPPGGVAPVGTLLFTRYLLPFELITVLVMIALVAAVVLARKKRPEDA
ncbi:MAG: NADH-quinone oxidoreductase subunit J [Acidobacteria bacterium]|nr:NADH-quinone oxidoreductase subunit J [Acidobacteriota bacterium]